jgi:cytochrome c-type biogenesis protein
MNTTSINVGLAFLAGLVSFLSPCMLPLVPIYLAQLVGRNISTTTQAQGGSQRLVTFLHALMFVSGFTLVFVTLGATASALGSVLSAYQFQLRQVGGVLLIIIGLHMTGVLTLPFFFWQKRWTFQPRQPRYLASLLIGSIFAVGWTPCISVYLGTILGLAATATTLKQGVLLLLFYALGMGLPFLLLGLGLEQANRILRWLKPYTHAIEVTAGLIMILTGVMIFFNWLVILNQFAVPLIRP